MELRDRHSALITLLRITTWQHSTRLAVFICSTVAGNCTTVSSVRDTRAEGPSIPSYNTFFLFPFVPHNRKNGDHNDAYGQQGWFFLVQHFHPVDRRMDCLRLPHLHEIFHCSRNLPRRLLHQHWDGMLAEHACSGQNLINHRQR